MYIKEVEIDNFKSFANTVTIPFLKGFTTISGPNGSGKSNIIDSILFALGLSTSRTLRAEKIYQLISTHTRRNEAYVKVTFASENPEENWIEEVSYDSEKLHIKLAANPTYEPRSAQVRLAISIPANTINGGQKVVTTSTTITQLGKE